MIQALLIDLDGVLRHWDNRDLFDFEAQLDLQPGYLFKRAFAPELSHPTIMGQHSHQVWLERVQESLAQSLNVELAAQLVALWEASTAELDLELWQGLKALFPRARFVLGTNASDRLDRDLESGFLAECERLNSSALGCMKPDENFYRKALAYLQLEPHTVLVIDDRAENIAAAHSLGFQTLHFQGREAALQQLQALQQRGGFLNVDLELYGDSFPQTLLDEWEQDVVILFAGANPRSPEQARDRNYPGELMVTLELLSEVSSARQAMERFVSLLGRCSERAQAEWNALSLRVFDFAYEMQGKQSAYEFLLAPECIRMAAAHNAAVAVSAYPCSTELSESSDIEDVQT